MPPAVTVFPEWGACHVAKPLGLPPYPAVAWEGSCGLAVCAETRDPCNVQLPAL